MALPRICIHKNRSLKKLKGFTVIEILVTVSLFALLSGVTLAFSTNYYREYNFYSEENLLISLLQKARSEAVNNINQKPHGVFFDKVNSAYVLFQGNSYQLRDQNMDFVVHQNGNYSLSGLDQIIFDQLSGDSISPGDVILDNHSGPKATISINQEGRIYAQQ